MILNMTGGQNDVQVIDFTLAEDKILNASGGTTSGSLIIPNVFLPQGLVHGFFIYTKNINIVTDMCVNRFYTAFFEQGVTQGNVWSVYYRGDRSEFLVDLNINTNAFVYVPSEKALYVAAYVANSIAKAGDYELVIW